MTIAIDIRSLQAGVGGVPEYTRNIVSSLLATEKKHTYILFTNAFGKIPVVGIPERGTWHSICRLKIPNKLLHASLALVAAPSIESLMQAACKIKPDILFMPNIHFIAFHASLPLVLTVHDISFAHMPELFSIKSRAWHALVRPERLIRRATRICAVSQWTANDIIRTYHIPERSVSVTHLGCASEFARISCDAYSKEKRTTILLFGANSKRKNTECCLEAFSQFYRSSPIGTRFALRLIGASPYARTRYARKYAGLPIFFTQHLSDDERLEAYSSAALLLYPSFFEGFGIPLLEAASSRVPIVSCQHSSIGEVIGNGAYAVDPYNSRDLSRAINEILSDEQLQDSFVNAAFCAAKKFSWHTAADKTRLIFEQAYAHRN